MFWDASMGQYLHQRETDCVEKPALLLWNLLQIFLNSRILDHYDIGADSGAKLSLKAFFVIFVLFCRSKGFFCVSIS